MDVRLASTEKHAEGPSTPRPGGQLLSHRPAGAPGEEERGSITPRTLRAHARNGDAPLPGGPHDLGLAPRDHILPRPEDAQGVELAPELDPEDGRVPPPADPLDAPWALEPERGEDRVRIQMRFIHSAVPVDPVAEELFLCLLPSPHYARGAICATLTLFCSTSRELSDLLVEALALVGDPHARSDRSLVHVEHKAHRSMILSTAVSLHFGRVACSLLAARRSLFSRESGVRARRATIRCT